MMIPWTNTKSYIVHIEQDKIYLGEFDNLGLTMSVDEPMRVEGYIGKMAEYPLYKAVKDISEEDIVEIFEKE